MTIIVFQLNKSVHCISYERILFLSLKSNFHLCQLCCWFIESFTSLNFSIKLFTESLYIFSAAEVLGSNLHADREELNRYKEQLLTSFKDQMELRRTLMELTNASMEISLETSRNQLVVSE